MQTRRILRERRRVEVGVIFGCTFKRHLFPARSSIVPKYFIQSQAFVLDTTPTFLRRPRSLSLQSQHVGLDRTQNIPHRELLEPQARHYVLHARPRHRV
jgi:hypothetical protein